VNRAKLTVKPSRGFFSFRQTVWSSAFYRRGYRIVATLTRPFRRFEIATVYRQDLAGRVNVFDAEVGVDIGQASDEEVVRAAETLGRRDPDRCERFRWRIDHGCICMVARAGPQIVGYTWLRLRPGPDDGDMIALAAREAFDFDLYVDENWRGHRIQTALSSRGRLFCKQQGYATIYTKVSVLNRNSLKSIRRSPWKASGVVLRVRGSRRGGWRIVTLWGSSHPLTRLRPGA
jgi:GNAT superfamily N-acetyltransferase